MSCKEAPEQEFLWAEGMARAWFCNLHAAEWLKYNSDDVNATRKVPNGVVSPGSPYRKDAIPEKDAIGEDAGNSGQDDWEGSWFNQIPSSGMGRFTYQRHYRGLTKYHSKLLEDVLLTKENMVHGDFRITTEGAELFNWTVHIGEANFIAEKGDRFTKDATEEFIQMAVKPLGDIGFLKPSPGDVLVTETEDTFSKYFGIDEGTYTVGVVRRNLVEIFVSGNVMKGRVLLQRPVVGSTRGWIAERGGEALAKTESLEQQLREVKARKEVGLIWADGESRPAFIALESVDQFLKVMEEQGEETALDVYRRKSDPVDMMIQKQDAEKRYTFGLLYKASPSELEPEVDAHGEFITATVLEEAIWDYVRRGDRRIFLQHMAEGMQPVGEWVNIVTWPYDQEVVMRLPNGQVNKTIIPAGSVWMGMIWNAEGWKLVKSSQVRGLSMGGMARRKDA